MADSVLQMYVSLAPVIIAGVLNMVWCSTSLAPQLDRPLDNHLVLRDGRRLLGDNKTWKGLVGMVALGVVAFVLWSRVLRGSSLGQWDLFRRRTTRPRDLTTQPQRAQPRTRSGRPGQTGTLLTPESRNDTAQTGSEPHRKRTGGSRFSARCGPSTRSCSHFTHTEDEGWEWGADSAAGA